MNSIGCYRLYISTLVESYSTVPRLLLLLLADTGAPRQEDSCRLQRMCGLTCCHHWAQLTTSTSLPSACHNHQHSDFTRIELHPLTNSSNPTPTESIAEIQDVHYVLVLPLCPVVRHIHPPLQADILVRAQDARPACAAIPPARALRATSRQALWPRRRHRARRRVRLATISHLPVIITITTTTNE